MRMRRLSAVVASVIALVLLGSSSPARADDTDGDGVDDALDVCINTPPGTAVDVEGRPLGDLDEDCDTDLDDFAMLHQKGATGLDEYALFQRGFTGPLGDGPPGMVLVPGSEFAMGDSFDEGGSNELPVHAVYVSPYYIDTYEVTNQHYAAALNWAYAEGGLIEVISGVVFRAGDSEPYCDTTTSSPYSRIHWDGATFTSTAGREDHPMLEVSWYGSAAFANWRGAMVGKPLCYDLSTWTCDFGVAGYRLPTEAEWEKAASWNPAEERHHRFGEHTDGCGSNCLDSQRGNYWESGDPYEVSPYPYTTPVGYYDGGNHGGYQTQNARSYYGCYDMSGNVYEWCNDWYEAGYYGSSPYEDPQGPATGTGRVMRGGGWNGFPEHCRSANRDYPSPANLYSNYGFRCALGTP